MKNTNNSIIESDVISEEGNLILKLIAENKINNDANLKSFDDVRQLL